ncbi:MAG: hypothetical protein EHM48_08005 [Planctomycetaceae bacterium]|nr:MAG: hypothetical protein EHM48_08005 [Planctomycetaceae bacterium]
MTLFDRSSAAPLGDFGPSTENNAIQPQVLFLNYNSLIQKRLHVIASDLQPDNFDAPPLCAQSKSLAILAVFLRGKSPRFPILLTALLTTLRQPCYGSQIPGWLTTPVVYRRNAPSQTRSRLTMPKPDYRTPCLGGNLQMQKIRNRHGQQTLVKTHLA